MVGEINFKILICNNNNNNIFMFLLTHKQKLTLKKYTSLTEIATSGCFAFTERISSDDEYF